MSQRVPITAADAPAAIGPYSHAIRHGDLLYCSGAIPIEPGSGEVVDSSRGAETEQCLRNLAAVCEAAGTELRKTVRATIYTTDLDDFPEINDAYAGFFPSEPPARVAVGVAALPKGVRVEIDAVVAVG
jgi:2-iminobutanoate/2-iminopropanoate deaminase